MNRKQIAVAIAVWLLANGGTEIKALELTDSVMKLHGYVMTLHDCMAYAVSHATKMRLQAADRNDERWQRRQAIMQVFTPNVDAQTYAYNQYGRNLDPKTNTYNSVTTFHNGYSVSAGITLFDGFKAINNMRMASTMVKLGRSKDQQAEDEICLATMEAYYNVIYYTELLRFTISTLGIPLLVLHDYNVNICIQMLVLHDNNVNICIQMLVLYANNVNICIQMLVLHDNNVNICIQMLVLHDYNVNICI